MAIPKLSERRKLDIGLVGQTINNSNVTGSYYDMRGYGKAMAVCIDGASAINKVTTLEFLQATDKAGTGAKVVKQGNASTGTESAAANTAAAAAVTKATEVTITFGTVLAGTTITINGVTFTAHATTTTAANREFSIAGTDAQDCTAFVGLVNNATYGVPGVTAVDGGAGSCTITSTEEGVTALDVSTSSISTAVIAITKQLLVSEIDIGDMDIAGGFYWLACKVTKTGNGIVAVYLEREPVDYVPVQAVAKATVL